MKQFFLVFSIIVSSAVVNAETIASCSGVKGYSFYQNLGSFSDKKSSGWDEDQITEGKTSVIRNDDGFDILFVDALGDINSLKDQGAKIQLLLIGQSSFALSSTFLGSQIEIYNFWQTNDGDLEYSITQVKGEISLLPKHSLLIGKCDSLKFSWMNEFFDES